MERWHRWPRAFCSSDVDLISRKWSTEIPVNCQEFRDSFVLWGFYFGWMKVREDSLLSTGVGESPASSPHSSDSEILDSVSENAASSSEEELQTEDDLSLASSLSSPPLTLASLPPLKGRISMGGSDKVDVEQISPDESRNFLRPSPPREILDVDPATLLYDVCKRNTGSVSQPKPFNPIQWSISDRWVITRSINSPESMRVFQLSLEGALYWKRRMSLIFPSFTGLFSITVSLNFNRISSNLCSLSLSLSQFPKKDRGGKDLKVVKWIVSNNPYCLTLKNKRNQQPLHVTLLPISGFVAIAQSSYLCLLRSQLGKDTKRLPNTSSTKVCTKSTQSTLLTWWHWHLFTTYYFSDLALSNLSFESLSFVLFFSFESLVCSREKSKQACISESQGVIDLLLEKGATLSLSDINGRTTIHYASLCGNLMSIQKVGRADDQGSMRESVVCLSDHLMKIVSLDRWPMQLIFKQH